MMLLHCLAQINSNTTPVTVQLSLSQYPVVFAHIQIQHLLMFNCNAYFAGRGYVRIQTQHLLMFNGILIDRCAVSKLIQIQHLLMFNTVTVLQSHTYHIQIQHLLMFNFSRFLTKKYYRPYSNTTPVTVQSVRRNRSK